MTLWDWWVRSRADAERAMEIQRQKAQSRLEHPSRYTRFMGRHRWLSCSLTLALLALGYFIYGVVVVVLVALAVVALQIWLPRQLNR